ncbi:MAG: transporter [Bacteroidales bacterium]|nr:transporter [Candidatus Liminaster caballi]
MLTGVAEYFVFVWLPFGAEAHRVTYDAVAHYIQPLLLFVMLFLSFIKVSPKEMRPHWWQLWVLLIQGSLFVATSLLAMLMPDEATRVLCEGAMLAFICPTATASAVIVGKLGGSVSGVVTYLMMCNLMVSLLAPALLPLVEPSEMTFFSSFLMILSKVFPLLICPLVLAWCVRFFARPLHRWLLRFKDLAFYVWAISLSLAIAVTVRSIVHSSVGVLTPAGLALISCVCCLVQFYVGKRIGSRYGIVERITAGQAFGQKNTVFVIWMGQVFLNPVTSVVGGFYSVWHNIINSWQLYRKQKE